MARIDIKNSAPMKALAAAKVKYPDFFKAADRIYKDPDAKWDKSICYCPIGLGVTYAVDLADLDSPTLAERGEISRTGATLAVLASWRKAKSIYTLDEDLEAELFKTSAKDMTVAPGMLTIPEWCIYVKTKLLQGCAGLFIMFDHAIQRGHKELYISAVTEEGTFLTSFYLILPDKPQKLTEILKGEEAVVRAKDVSKTPELAPYVSSYFKASRQAIRFTINLLLYLSAVNAEVKQVNKLSFPRQGRVKDTPREWLSTPSARLQAIASAGLTAMCMSMASLWAATIGHRSCTYGGRIGTPLLTDPVRASGASNGSRQSS